MSTTATAPTPATTAKPAKAASPAWTLARVEGRRLVTHPLFVFGLATSLAAIVLADSGVIERSAMLSGDCFVMLGGALWTFLAAFLATSRERRDGAHDFYAGTPLTARLRTNAALASIGFAGLAAAALVAIASLLLAGPDGVLVIDGAPHPGEPLPPHSYVLDPIELARGPVYLMTAGVFGVLAGIWTRSVFAGAIAALMLFLPPIALLPRFVFDQTLSAGFYGAVKTDPLIGAGFAGWQLLAMVGVAAFAAAAALMRHDRGWRLVSLALAGAGATAAAIALGPRAVG